MVKLAKYIVAVVAVTVSALAGMPDLASPELDPEKLARALSDVDHATIQFHESGLKSPVIVTDKAWLVKFSAYLKALRGTPIGKDFALGPRSVNLYSGDNRVLSVCWRFYDSIEISSDDWRVNLKVGEEAFRLFCDLCDEKKEL